MTFEDMLPTIISMVGGFALNGVTVFSGRFNRWLDKFTPDQKYFITAILSGALGVVITVALSCAGLLSVLSCGRDLGPQLTLSALSAATGNKAGYDAAKVVKKVNTPTGSGSPPQSSGNESAGG